MVKKILLFTLLVLNVGFAFANYTPKLSNFRIENAQKNRVYFDSSLPLKGSSATGFAVSNKSVNDIFISVGKTTGHYVTVSSPFTWWDNNTIRYEGGSDITDSNNNALSEFTLTYIHNNISEPSASTIRYASASGSGSRNGTSEDNAWSYSEAFRNARSGMTVYMKAGVSSSGVTIGNSGTATAPIKFIGYKNSINDITSNYYKYSGKGNNALKTNEMPTLRSSSTDNGKGISATGKEYIIIRNFQVEGFREQFKSSSDGKPSNYFVFHRFNGHKAGSLKQNDAYGIKFHSGTNGPNGFYRNDAKSVRIKDCVFINHAMASVSMRGEGGCLMDNVKTYSDRYETDPERNDYHLAIGGWNNIIRNCHAENFNNTHSNLSTHGIGIRGASQWRHPRQPGSQYNLIVGCTSVNNYDGIYLRNYKSDNNVVKNCVIKNNGNKLDYRSGGLGIMSGCDNNIFENNDVYDTAWGIYFTNNQEDGSSDRHTGHGNIFRNCNFYRNVRGIFMHTATSGATANNNKILNCNFYDNKNFYNKGGEGTVSVSNFTIVNTNIVKSRSIGNRGGSDLKFDHSNFYDNGFSKPGGTNFSENPQFENASSGNFKLKPQSKLINRGKKTSEVKTDFEGNDRPQGSSHEIGAYEFNDNSTTVNANAGPDVTICKGENTTLTASGGDSYLWSTGETTASITVNPATTTTYNVTATKDGNSGTDEVKVTVNNPPTVSLGDDLTICSGKGVTLTATGTGNFVWNTGETTASINVSPNTTTTYTVTASGGCGSDATDEIVVNVTPTPTVNAGADVTICSGASGSVTLTATGTGNFVWSTGETTASINVKPSTTTTYSVTSTTGDCSATDEVKVTVNESSSVSLGNDITICKGDSTTLTATGTGNFVWSTDETTASIEVNPTETTTYSVTSSGGCGSDATDEIIVTVNEQPSVELGNDHTIESGQSVRLTATGTGNFVWSTGETTPSIIVNPNNTTIYSVRATNESGCSAEDQVQVNVQDSNIISVQAGSNYTICKGKTVIINAPDGDTYLWNTGETSKSISVEPNQNIVYSVKVYIGKDNTVHHTAITVNDDCNSTNNGIGLNKEMIMYPNPTDGEISIRLLGYKEKLNITLISINGSIIYQETIDNTSSSAIVRKVDLSNYAKGVYFLRLNDVSNNTKTKKILLI